jgi:hypothetical protein
VNKVNHAELIEAGKATRFGAGWPGTRCLAKTRRGTLCQNPAIGGPNRCRLHGGKSTGAKTTAGKARVVAANTKHGKRTRRHAEKVKALKTEIKRVIFECRRAGLLS